MSSRDGSLPTVTVLIEVNVEQMLMYLHVSPSAGESLRVDFVLGQGAFATVYQATNLMTTQKLFLKVTRKHTHLIQIY